MSQYRTLDDQQVQQAEIKFFDGKPWRFENLLPFDVKVVMSDKQRSKHITTLKAFASADINHLRAGLVIHVLATSPIDEKEYEILRPEVLRGDSRLVRIGDVGTLGHDVQYKHPHADIANIRFHNRTLMPLSVFHQNYPLAKIDVDDGLEYSAGSRNSAYVDNDSRGFQLGDEIKFKLAGRDYISIILSDNLITDIYVGMINQKITVPPPDIYGYKVDVPSITGITYFEPQGAFAYRTVKSNPYASQ